MHSSINEKKITSSQWKWFIGLYVVSLIGYGVTEFGLHYLNVALVSL